MIIGLSGFARSGKDTAADFMHGYRRRSFATPIRWALLTLNPLIAPGVTVRNAVDRDGWDVAKVTYPELRRLLQVLGTEVGRQLLGDDVWVHLALRGLNPDDRVVFTDVRFPNEAQAIKDLGGQVWRITRPGVLEHNAHQSESALNEWDFDKYIHNDGSLADLAWRVGENLPTVGS